MLLSEIEQALIDRVRDVLPEFPVQSFPQNPSTFSLLQPKGALLIRFAGSSYKTLKDMGAVVQERATLWEITAVGRNLMDHRGLYAMLDGVRVALTGFRVPGCDKAVPVEDEFVSVNEGVWQYVFIVSIKSMNVELEEVDALPLLRRLTLADNFDEVTEIP